MDERRCSRPTLTPEDGNIGFPLRASDSFSAFPVLSSRCQRRKRPFPSDFCLPVAQPLQTPVLSLTERACQERPAGLPRTVLGTRMHQMPIYPRKALSLAQLGWPVSCLCPELAWAAAASGDVHERRGLPLPTKSFLYSGSEGKAERGYFPPASPADQSRSWSGVTDAEGESFTCPTAQSCSKPSWAPGALACWQPQSICPVLLHWVIGTQEETAGEGWDVVA